VKKIAGALALLILFGYLLMVAVYLHPFGEPQTEDMDKYFIERGQAETGANNIVTSIVFDYRGFDTLGEATVLFSAVTGVALLFKKKKEVKE